MSEINKYRDWGGDDNNLPLTGAEVQRFIKQTFDEKIGYIHRDETKNMYQMFADEETYNKYIENPSNNSNLLLGEIPGEFPYIIKIGNDEIPFNNHIAVSQADEKKLVFPCVVTDKSGNEESFQTFVLSVIVNCGNITNKKTYTQTITNTQNIELNLEGLVNNGINYITINIKGLETGATKVVSAYYNVIEISYNTTLDNFIAVSDKITINGDYSVPETTKFYYSIDGGNPSEFAFNEKKFELDLSKSSLRPGKHYIATYCIYKDTLSNSYESDYCYDEFLIINDDLEDSICISTIIPRTVNLPKEVIDTLYGIKQYVPFNFKMGVYLQKSDEFGIYLNNSLLNQYKYSQHSYYVQSIKLYNSDNNTIQIKNSSQKPVRNLKLEVNNICPTLSYAKDFISFEFSALEKTNDSLNKDTITGYEDQNIFTNCKWDSNFGWKDNYLKLAPNSSFSLKHNCFEGIDYALGRSIILEFMTSRVSNDSTDLIGKIGTDDCGIHIYGNKIALIDTNHSSIETFFNSEELVNISFVIYGTSTNGKYADNLVIIYINGIASGCINSSYYTINDSNIEFSSTDTANIYLRSIKVFNKALSHDEIVDNFILSKNNEFDILEAYFRNDIYENKQLNLNKLGLNIPYMIIKGLDVEQTVQNETDTEKDWQCDISYVNTQNPKYSFELTNGTLRLQGTSSLSYIRKNFRIYTEYNNRIGELTINEKLQEDNKYSFKEHAQPVKCWCLKADYAESSGTHNVGIARLWGEAWKTASFQNINNKMGQWLQTGAQVAAAKNKYPYDVRTTIDGFPILLFNEYTDDKNNTNIKFLGKYNFNNDKSTESVFGFCDIVGFDNQRMQCWEMRHNENPYCLFIKSIRENGEIISDLDDYLEPRYFSGEKSQRVKELALFSDWVSGFYNNEDNYTFAKEKWEHLDVYKIAAYWCYLTRHAAADQFVKNSMLTSEDGEHYYFILYDNDTINGLNNDGQIIIPPTVTRDTTYDNSTNYMFAGRNSVLWNMLENDDEFQEIVRIVDRALTKEINYLSAINMFDGNFGNKWVERIYNLDGEYKYILPKDSTNYGRFHGKREQHRKWWLKNRFDLIDAQWVSGNYSNAISWKCQGDITNSKIKIIPESTYWFGFGINGKIYASGIEIGKDGGEIKLTTYLEGNKIAIGDPIAIYGMDYMEELDLSSLPLFQQGYTKVSFPKLKQLILGGNDNVEYSLTGLALVAEGVQYHPNLEVLNIDIPTLETVDGIDSLKYLKKLYASKSKIKTLALSDGAPIEVLELPETIMSLTLKNINNEIDLSYLKNLQTINITGCSSIINNIDNQKVLLNAINRNNGTFTLDEVDWNVSYSNVITILKKLGDGNSLHGILRCENLSRDQKLHLLKNYSEYLDKNSDLYIEIGNYFIIDTQNKSANENEEIKITVYSSYANSIEWSLTRNDNKNVKYQINKDENCYTLVLNEQFETTEYTYELTINATLNGLSSIKDKLTMNISTLSYPDSIEILGRPNVLEHLSYAVNGAEECTGKFDIVCTISDLENYINIVNCDKNNIQLKQLQELENLDDVIDGTLSITLTAQSNKDKIWTAELNVVLLGKNVLVTPVSNQPLYNYLSANGYEVNNDKILKSAVENIEEFELDDQYVKYFNEFQHFTKCEKLVLDHSNVRELSLPSTLTIFQCYNHYYEKIDLYVNDLKLYFNIDLKSTYDFPRTHLYLIENNEVVDLESSLTIPPDVDSIKPYAINGDYKKIIIDHDIYCKRNAINITSTLADIELKEDSNIYIDHPYAIQGNLSLKNTNLRKFLADNTTENVHFYWIKNSIASSVNLDDKILIWPINQEMDIVRDEPWYIGVAPDFESTTRATVTLNLITDFADTDTTYNLSDFIRTGNSSQINAEFDGCVKIKESNKQSCIVEFNKGYFLQDEITIYPFDLILPDSIKESISTELGNNYDTYFTNTIKASESISYEDIFGEPFVLAYQWSNSTNDFAWKISYSNQQIKGRYTSAFNDLFAEYDFDEIPIILSHFGLQDPSYQWRYGLIYCDGSHAIHFSPIATNYAEGYDGKFIGVTEDNWKNITNHDYGLTYIKKGVYPDPTFYYEASGSNVTQGCTFENLKYAKDGYYFQIYRLTELEASMMIVNIDDTLINKELNNEGVSKIWTTTFESSEDNNLLTTNVVVFDKSSNWGSNSANFYEIVGNAINIFPNANN